MSPPKQSPAQAALARNLTVLGFAGTDDRYVYFESTDSPNSDIVNNFLMRAPKGGGPAEIIPALEHAVVLGLGPIQEGRRFVIVASNNTNAGVIDGDPDPLPVDVAAIDQAGRQLTPILRQRHGLAALTVTAAGLAWLEGADKSDRGGAEKVTVFTSDLDGGNIRAIWKGSSSGPVQLIARGSDLYLFLGAPKQVAIPPKGPSGKWRYVKPGTYSTVLQIPRAGGTPQVVWKEPDLLHKGLLDGGDLFVCAEDGLYKVSVTGPRGSTRLAGQCSDDVRIWHGWKLQWNGTPEVQPILFGPIGPTGEMRELFHRTMGGAATDDQAIYVCVPTADSQRCDLTRIDGAGLVVREKTASP